MLPLIFMLIMHIGLQFSDDFNSFPKFKSNHSLSIYGLFQLWGFHDSTRNFQFLVFQLDAYALVVEGLIEATINDISYCERRLFYTGSDKQVHENAFSQSSILERA